MFFCEYFGIWGRNNVNAIATRYGREIKWIESRWWRHFSHPPSILHSGYRMSFLGVSWLGRGFNQPPTSGAEVKESLELHFYSPSVPSWEVIVLNLPLLHHGSPLSVTFHQSYKPIFIYMFFLPTAQMGAA